MPEPNLALLSTSNGSSRKTLKSMARRNISPTLTAFSCPGGFGDRGIEGKILPVNMLALNKIPYLGLCLGMQTAVIEFARNVANMQGAHSTEFNPQDKYPVIDLMPDQHNVTLKGGTMRLGKYPCHLKEGSKAQAVYGKETIHERHRHRYEVNNSLRAELAKAGMVFSGLSPDENLVEMIELPNHPFFVACQFHPELKSRPDNAHPLFVGLVDAMMSEHARKVLGKTETPAPPVMKGKASAVHN